MKSKKIKISQKSQNDKLKTTYFNFKKSLKAGGTLELPVVPRFKLTAKPPEVPNLEEAVKAASEQEQIRNEQKQTEEKEEEEYRDMEDKYFDDDEEE